MLTITNCGTLPLTINSISAAATVFTVPASENECPQTIAAAWSCTVAVRYSPTSPGTSSNSTLTIESNAPIPQIVLSLGGTSTAAPVATFSPSSLTFASQEVGNTSAVQTVTLTNTGTANLTNFIMELTGANTAFSETSTTCNLTIAIGSSCSINVTFTPGSAGAVMASLVILDANGVTLSPQPLTISGTGTQSPFTIATQTGGSTGSTVSAGKSATYALAALPANGYSGTLALNCSNLPTNASLHAIHARGNGKRDCALHRQHGSQPNERSFTCHDPRLTSNSPNLLPTLWRKT